VRRFEVDVEGFDPHVWKSFPNLTDDLKGTGKGRTVAAQVHDKPGVHGPIGARQAPGHSNATYTYIERVPPGHRITE